MVNSSSKSFQGATQLDASVSCKLWNILNHEFSPNITKERLIAYCFVCFRSFPFFVQKRVGSSSFSTNLQRNHAIGGLQLQADVSTNSCVSSFVFRIVNYH
jgi:dipeptide/tripeptide permease